MKFRVRSPYIGKIKQRFIFVERKIEITTNNIKEDVEELIDPYCTIEVVEVVINDLAHF